MPKFTALVHVEESSRETEATIKTVSLANDVLVVLDGEEPEKRKIMRKWGARVKTTVPGVSPGAYAMDAYHDWVLVMRPGEVLTERTKERLLLWKKQKRDAATGYWVQIRQGGRDFDAFRLVNRNLINWIGELPPEQKGAKEISQAA